MPVARFSANIDACNDFAGELFVANAARTGREWYEVRRQGGWYQDRLSHQDAVTGMPTALDLDIYAETVICAVSDPGEWTVAWDGGGTVSVTLLGGSGLSVSGSSMPSALTQEPVSAGGSFTFQHDGVAKQAIVRITDILTTNPVSNLRVGPTAHSADWGGFSTRFKTAMQQLRPPMVRVLDLQEPCQPIGTTVVDYADRRKETWWTESNIALDVYSFAVAAWDGGTPALGDTIQYLNGAVVVGSGTFVRAGSPVPGAFGHIKHGSGSLGQTGWTARCVRNGATATFSSNMAWWQPITRGASHKLIRDLAAWLKTNAGLQTLWCCWSTFATDDFHTQTAAEFAADARLVGLKQRPELGNERWNSAISSRDIAYANAEGTTLGLPGANATERGAQWGAKRQHELHELWKDEFVGRESEIVHIFAGQNVAGEDWYRLRTILNPENDPAFLPTWPRTYYQADVWAVAPYPGQLDQAPWNDAGYVAARTDNELFAYLIGSELGRHVTDAISGTMPLRSGGFESHRVYASERQALGGQAAPCVLDAYEWNTHFVGSTAPAHATLLRFHGSAQYAEAYQRIAEEIKARAAGACAYQWTRRRGQSVGFWDVIEGWDGSTPFGVRWTILNLLADEGQEDIEFSEGTTHYWAPACTLELVPPDVQTVDLQVAPAAGVFGATAVGFDAIAPIDQELSSRPALVRVGATACRMTIEEEEQLLDGAPALVQVAATATNLLQEPPAGQVVDLRTAEACFAWQGSATAVVTDEARLSSAPATVAHGARATVLEAAPARGGSKAFTIWQPRHISWGPKALGVELRRTMLLTFAPIPEGQALFPLEPGKLFGGIAVRAASVHRHSVLYSRTGSVLVDFEGPEVLGTRFTVVAIDPVRLMSLESAAAQGMAYTELGIGLVTEPGYVLLDYRGVAF